MNTLEWGSDQAWRVDAACRGVDPALFFPQVRPGRDDQRLRAARFVAETYCQRCPVLALCHDLAERTKSVGIWAGSYRRALGDASIKRVPLVPAAPKREAS